MNRTHKIITIEVSYNSKTLVPGLPGSGEMEFERGPDGQPTIKPYSKIVRVIAAGPDIARAALAENPYRYPDATYRIVSVEEIDMIVETHTY